MHTCRVVERRVQLHTFQPLQRLKENRLFAPSSLSIALLMMITSAVCWGSWANTYKGVKGYRFELFYWDYAIGIFLISLALAFTMGSTGHDSSSFLNNVRAADPSNIVNALIGGALFNLANPAGGCHRHGRACRGLSHFNRHRSGGWSCSELRAAALAACGASLVREQKMWCDPQG